MQLQRLKPKLKSSQTLPGLIIVQKSNTPKPKRPLVFFPLQTSKPTRTPFPGVSTSLQPWISYKSSVLDISQLHLLPRSFFATMFMYIKSNVKSPATCVDQVYSVIDDMQTVGYRPTRYEFQLILECFEHGQVLDDISFLLKSVKAWPIVDWTGESPYYYLKDFMSLLLDRYANLQVVNSFTQTVLFIYELDRDLFQLMLNDIVSLLLNMKETSLVQQLFEKCIESNVQIPYKSFQNSVSYLKELNECDLIIPTIESSVEAKIIDLTLPPKTINHQDHSQISYLRTLMHILFCKQYTDHQIFENLLYACLCQRQFIEADILWEYATLKKPHQQYINKVFVTPSSVFVYIEIMILQHRIHEVQLIYRRYLASMSNKKRRSAELHLLFVQFFVENGHFDLALDYVKMMDEVGIKVPLKWLGRIRDGVGCDHTLLDMIQKASNIELIF